MRCRRTSAGGRPWRSRKWYKVGWNLELWGVTAAGGCCFATCQAAACCPPRFLAVSARDPARGAHTGAPARPLGRVGSRHLHLSVRHDDSCALCTYVLTLSGMMYAWHAGAVERAVQELPAPRGGEPAAGAAVAGLLPVPARGPGGAAAGQQRHAAAVPGLHLGRPHALHAAPLPRRHPHAGRLHPLALPRPSPSPGGGGSLHLASERAGPNKQGAKAISFAGARARGSPTCAPRWALAAGRWRTCGLRAPRRLPIFGRCRACRMRASTALLLLLLLLRLLVYIRKNTYIRIFYIYIYKQGGPPVTFSLFLSTTVF